MVEFQKFVRGQHFYGTKHFVDNHLAQPIIRLPPIENPLTTPLNPPREFVWGIKFRAWESLMFRDRLRRRTFLRHLRFAVALIAIFSVLPISSFAFSPANAEELKTPRFATDLSLAARAGYQNAIDDVNWRHTVWPEANGARPARPAQRNSAEQAGDVLRKSNALSTLWGQAITGQMLQAEIDRMVRDSKRPELLRQLFASLNNNPTHVAEVIARPLLVDRLSRNFFTNDQRFKSKDFGDWWRAAKTEFSTSIETPVFKYNLPDFPLAAQNFAGADGDSWRPMSALPVSTGTAVWTGTEMIVWGNGTDSGSRYNPATDHWSPTSMTGAPSARRIHTAVWTGTEMIVWGGCNTSTSFCGETTGGRYNPTTDTWTPTSTVDAPIGRKEHTAVWSGSEMLVWGGCKPGYNNFCNTIGSNSTAPGGAYNLNTDTWREIPPPPITGRTKHTAIWTGGEMIIWGGIDLDVKNDGARYNPNTGWVAMTLTNAPTPRMEHTAVWTGTEMIVWGGREPSSTSSLNTGGRYNPTTNSWTATSLVNAPAPRIGHTAVWTGTEMIVWGGDLRANPWLTNTGGRYRPDTDSWTPTNPTNAPAARANHVAVWTGSVMIVWSTADNKSGGRYDPQSGSWTPTKNRDSAPTVYNGVWTGTEMIVWGTHPSCLSGCPAAGGRYNPALDEWREINLDGGPPAPDRDQLATAVWTGTEMIVWGKGENVFDAPGEGGRYNPMTDSWTLLSKTNAPVARSLHTAVWTGSEMIVWGGQDYQGTFRTDGGRYNPSTNSWQPLNTTGAPEARYLHTAVWSGSEMIIWGGANYSSLQLSTGGRYNPGTNSWQPTDITNAPIPRRYHTAVWSGTEMIVWGGRSGDFNNNDQIYETGGRYNPQTNSWQPTSLINAPLARFKHSAVWTGNTMIVWGGLGKTGVAKKEVATGGVYDPVSDLWTPTSLERAPSARSAHVALWTGEEMIIWGGDRSNYTGTATHGALYTPAPVSIPTPTPTPTATPTPTVTPTPTPTVTPTPTPTATPTPTPSPAATPTPTPPPTATPTPTPSVTPTPSPTPTPQTIQFGATDYSLKENQQAVSIVVSRSGDVSGVARVDYATVDSAEWDDCSAMSGFASSRCDYGKTFGTLSFAAGETSKTITIPVTSDAYAEGEEHFIVQLSNASGASLGAEPSTTVVINDDFASSQTNPIDADTFFVRQHYLDFLNREPDSDGLAFWVNQITACGADARCREVKRIHVSAAFFLSIEFQETGYFAYRMYKAGYGDTTSPNVTTAVPVVRLQEFLTDAQFLGSNMRVGIGDWQNQLAANRSAYARAFVTRARFIDAFPLTLTLAAFVDRLNQNAGNVLTTGERDQLVAELAAAPDATTGRASVLTKIAEHSTLKRNESNRAFVLMEYYGYLRRNPDDPQNVDFTGWEFWLNKLNSFNGDFVGAEMVKAFLISNEYRHRFGP